jgi:hypothetical protein
MFGPDREPLARAFLKIAAAYDRPSTIAGKNTPTCFELIFKVRIAKQPRYGAENGDNDAQALFAPVFLVLPGGSRCRCVGLCWRWKLWLIIRYEQSDSNSWPRRSSVPVDTDGRKNFDNSLA